MAESGEITASEVTTTNEVTDNKLSQSSASEKNDLSMQLDGVLSDKEVVVSGHIHSTPGALRKIRSWWRCIYNWLRGLTKFAGPGWLICIALIDPGNYEGDIQAGAGFEYKLIWIIWWSSVVEVFIQILTIRLGLYAKMDLAQACRRNYPRYIRYILWILSEAAMMATDLLQVIGFAVSCEILFQMPLYAGVLLSFATTLLILSLQYLNIHYLELFVMVMILVMSVTFFIQWSMVDTNGTALMRGWVIPSLPSGSALVALSQIGASVSPHNVFLQSSLVQTRRVELTKSALHSAYVYNVVEFIFPMVLAFVVNLALISLAAVGFYKNPLIQIKPQNISLIDTCNLIKTVYAQTGVGCILFGISLLASAQSATVSATYAGQIVMEGFLNIKIPLWLRNLMTRTITIIPGLIVAIFAGNNGSGLALLIGSSILSGVIPFLIFPLLKFTQSERCMGSFRNPKWVSVVMWIIGLGIAVANVYLIAGAQGNRTLQSALSSLSVASIFGIIATVVIGLGYLGLLVFLIFYPVQFDSCVHQIDN
ncbi:metal ion (Mn2+-iron) transporter, Nramp family [Galdieria sulphuraria]|uniref:Metal ion (Mn2+-iron) transporter, Nramp family n=1 Tax=Galdieria sulphuraria TaxID=130081 RepID=M2Y255_GALSU|nr:metal ion (Mn2+-iron) transporter, Nramp family [Galdieria sulphuraria]EME29889.1 metal ion (Mn2+-iron) transporter, Nramp family [Galdieria sulphuraria]|eukprot:XP_005706409.1 metal ion (Mn2+-iron) transporter, Nramp family [Galdieria sulphuraria]